MGMRVHRINISVNAKAFTAKRESYRDSEVRGMEERQKHLQVPSACTFGH